MVNLDYNSLPDCLQSEYLETLFKDLIDNFHRGSLNNQVFIENIIILTDININNEDDATLDLKDELESILISFWDLSDYTIIDSLLYLFINLKLDNGLKLARKELETKEMVDKVRKEIEDSLKEMGLL